LNKLFASILTALPFEPEILMLEALFSHPFEGLEMGARLLKAWRIAQRKYVLTSRRLRIEYAELSGAFASFPKTVTREPVLRRG
jgi:hypothetical protein